MSPLDEFDTALMADSARSATSASETAKKSGSRNRLSVELDFGRVSHQTESSSTHPHVLFSPLHYEPGYAYPLLVWLHGSGGDERQVMRIMPILSMRNYVAVAPQGLTAAESTNTPHQRTSKSDWNSLDVASILRDGISPKVLYDWPDTEEGLTEAERRVFDCISVATKRSNIAPDRIFLAGFGTGGTLALRLAFLYPEHFAGVASLCGPFPQGGQILHRWTAARNLSVFLGIGDTSVGPSPTAVCETLELFHTAGVSTMLREYACGREIAPEMLRDINRWMMNIVCS